MSSPQLEQRVAILEAEVAHLKRQLETTSTLNSSWWEKVSGTFGDNSGFDEAMSLGRKYRESLRPASEQKHTS